jgi:PAS domain S-box-containing protein
VTPDDPRGPAHDDAQSWSLDALDTIVDGVMVVDHRARLVYANAAARRMTGIERLEDEPSRWSVAYGVLRPDEKTPWPAEELPLVRALAGEARSGVEMFVRNEAVKEGRHLVVSASPLRDGKKIRGAAIILHDVTARRRAEARAVEGERQRKAILDNIPDMAWLKDRDGRFVAINERFARAAAMQPDDLIGLKDLDVWPRALAEKYRAEDDEVMRQRQHKTIEEEFIDASGRHYWLETVKACILGEDGEVIGTTGIARDITERRLAEEALRTTNDELERRVARRTAELAEAQDNLVRKERLAVLGQLAGGVAHQIRNPLAAIMNATYVLKRHLSPEQHPNVEDAIRIIHDEVRHANVIITGLLDHARVRAPDRHPASLVDIVDKALAADVVVPGVRVVRAVDADAPLLEIDADQLHAALTNVIRNAIEAMSGEGELRVELGRERDEIVIAVADSGPGISPAVRAHLFEPLHSTKPMGVGLGLVTARTFIEAHGGTIACVDVPRGARFEIRLPAKRPSAQAQAQAPAAPLSAKERGRGGGG